MLSEQFSRKWSGYKLDSIQCDTCFVDDINNKLQYFLDIETGMYGDKGYTRHELLMHTDDFELVDKVFNIVCQRYDCEMVDDEIQAEHPEQVLQAMMAIYAWFYFKRYGL